LKSECGVVATTVAAASTSEREREMERIIVGQFHGVGFMLFNNSRFRVNSMIASTAVPHGQTNGDLLRSPNLCSDYRR
jgi:hypothetical protein